MNTKPIPAFLSLFAGGMICIFSIIYQLDVVEFAKKFVIGCLIFFAIGLALQLILNIGMKQKKEHSLEDPLENIEAETNQTKDRNS